MNNMTKHLVGCKTMKNKDHKKASRQRKRDAGLVPVEVWIKKEHKEKLKEIVKGLNNE